MGLGRKRTVKEGGPCCIALARIRGGDGGEEVNIPHFSWLYISPADTRLQQFSLHICDENEQVFLLSNVNTSSSLFDFNVYLTVGTVQMVPVTETETYVDDEEGTRKSETSTLEPVKRGRIFFFFILLPWCNPIQTPHGWARIKFIFVTLGSK